MIRRVRASKAKVKFQKVGGKKREKKMDVARPRYIAPMSKPQPLSRMAQQVLEFQDPKTGKPSTLEIIRQVQDACQHTVRVIATSASYGKEIKVVACTECGAININGWNK